MTEHVIRLRLRHGRSGGIESDEVVYDDIDLNRLSPRARGLAEAIAQRPERNRGAITILDPAGERVVWSNWSAYPVDSQMDPHDYLEQQAARFPGDWTIPGTGQDQEWIARQCADAWGVKPATWRSYVSRGQAPKPVRRIGATPVWDPTEVMEWPRPGQGARTDRARAEEQA